jgi:type IV secretion system protein VirD4
MRKNFGENANIILDNIDTQIFFGINSIESAEAVSKRGGDATILIDSLNKSRSRSRPERYTGHDGGSVSDSTSLTLSQHGRPLFRPDEVTRLPDNLALVFHKNLPVIPVRLVPYFAPELARGYAGQRGVGLSALLVALLALSLSFCLAAAAVLMPSAAVPPRQRPQPGYYAPAPAFGHGYGGNVPALRPGYAPPQRGPYPPPRGGGFPPPPPYAW